MKETFRFFILISASLLSYCCFAVGFEDGGVVEAVDLGRGTILVDGVVYQLPNNVKESSRPSAGPAIMQLKVGMYIFFYGKDSVGKVIDSLSIHEWRKNER